MASNIYRHEAVGEGGGSRRRPGERAARVDQGGRPQVQAAQGRPLLETSFRRHLAGLIEHDPSTTS